MGETIKALVLPQERVSGAEPKTIPDLPGRWQPDRGYAPEALGLTLKQAKELLAELNLPLEIRDFDEAEVAYSFDRPAGSHIPSSLARPENVRLAEAGIEPEPVVNDQGVPVTTRTPPSPDVVPLWLKPTIERDTAGTLGELPEGQPITRSEMSDQITGGAVARETPTLELSEEMQASIEASASYKKMLKADLVALAEQRGLDTDGTADELRERLVAADTEPSVGPEEFTEGGED